MIRKLGLYTLTIGLLALPCGARAQETQKDLPGPIDSVQDLQDTGKMLFKIADKNNDGQISQKEAQDAANMMVGGAFFSADVNGDGVLSKDELQQARQNMANDRPMLRVIMARAQAQPGATNTANNARQNIMSLIDSNNDGQIQSSELRQMVATGVQSGFAASDTNRDGQLSPTEVNAAMIGAARSAAQAAFKKADTDNNGQLSQAEFDKALVEPANTAFRMLDTNNDGQLSQQEAQAASRLLMSQLRALQMPDAPNSARNLINQGAQGVPPRAIAPVPSFGTPGQPGATPAPPATPAQPQ